MAVGNCEVWNALCEITQSASEAAEIEPRHDFPIGALTSYASVPRPPQNDVGVQSRGRCRNKLSNVAIRERPSAAGPGGAWMLAGSPAYLQHLSKSRPDPHRHRSSGPTT